MSATINSTYKSPQSVVLSAIPHRLQVHIANMSEGDIVM